MPSDTAHPASQRHSARPADPVDPGNGNSTALGGTVVFGDFGEPNNLNPMLSMQTFRVQRLIWEGLVKVDPKTGAPIPGLAQSWDQSPDGLTYTFHIRPNVKWSDGAPFTADDAQFTYDAVRDPRTKSPYASLYQNVRSLDVVDPLTLPVTLKQPSCPFLQAGTGIKMGIMPKHLLGKSADIATDDFNVNPSAGTGPFVFKEWQHGDHITLVANPNYWQGMPKLDQWIFKVAPDVNSQASQLKTGELDYTAVQADALEDLLRQPNLDVKTFTLASCETIAYNLDRPIFQDKRVRQALIHALDRNLIVQTVLAGQGTVVNTPVPATSWAFDSSISGFAFDLEAAQRLLADAGWLPGPDGILTRDGVPFKYTFMSSPGNAVRAAVLTIVQAQYRKLGINVDLQILETNAYNARFASHDFDAAIFQIFSDADPDLSAYFLSSEYPAGLNYTKYSNPEVDQILTQAAALPGCGQEPRKQLYARFQQIVSDEQPYMFLFTRKSLYAYNKRIQGLDPSGWAASDWNVHTWQVSR